MPKVSVIIPCYNLGQYLDEAVDSVLKQTYQDFEIIIINDGSSDKFTNTLLKSYSRPKTTVYHTINQGLPATRNYGIEKASGDYICCLDADDKYHPEYLRKTVDVLEKDSKEILGFVTTWVQLIGKVNMVWQTSDYNPPLLCFQNIVHVSSLFRKKCWIEVYGYAIDLAGYQDWNFWLNIVSRGYKWRCIKEPLFYYRKGEKSMVDSSDIIRDTIVSDIVKKNISLYRDNIVFIISKYEKLIMDFRKKQGG